LSEQGGQERSQQVISVEQLLVEVERLKRSIDTLQSALLEINESILSIDSAKKSIEIMKSQDKYEFLVTIDKKGYLVGKINNILKDKVLVRLGSKFYVEIDLENALKILERREEELKKVSQSLQAELAKQLQYYNQLVDLLNQIQAQAQKGE
jgi:prefoldin alpha subunit